MACLVQNLRDTELHWECKSLILGVSSFHFQKKAACTAPWRFEVAHWHDSVISESCPAWRSQVAQLTWEFKALLLWRIGQSVGWMMCVDTEAKRVRSWTLIPAGLTRRNTYHWHEACNQWLKSTQALDDWCIVAERILCCSWIFLTLRHLTWCWPGIVVHKGSFLEAGALLLRNRMIKYTWHVPVVIFSDVKGLSVLMTPQMVGQSSGSDKPDDSGLHTNNIMRPSCWLSRHYLA